MKKKSQLIEVPVEERKIMISNYYKQNNLEGNFNDLLEAIDALFDESDFTIGVPDDRTDK